MLRTLVLAAAVALGQSAALEWSKVWNRLPTKGNTASLSSNSTLATVRNCGSSTDIAKNLVISITPDAPKAGQEVTTIFDYDLEQEITGGTATYKFSFNGIPFSPTVDDLCVDQAGGCCPDPCPLAVGHHTDKSISNFPSGISGKIVSTILWADQNKNQILCVEWTVRV